MERTVEAVCAAVSDAGYPPAFRDAVARWVRLVAPRLALERTSKDDDNSVNAPIEHGAREHRG